YGISVLAVKRHGEADAVVSPDGETVLMKGDTVVVIGESRALGQMLPLFLCDSGTYCELPNRADDTSV
ncbi:MAG TPA: hypothetical protein O0W86_01260, partial [Methanocorpusculum sp.]|nr:hypothetical protein [Methanocorpusculum sp.]